MKIRQAVAVSQPGQRDHNEDAVLRVPSVPLFGVADGMGGPGVGDAAANLALDLIKQAAPELREFNDRVARTRSTADRLALSRRVDQVINAVSREIHRQSAKPGKGGMGSTLVLCTLVRNYAYVAHVGDSRAYLLRKGRLLRLTEDHSVAELHLRRGKITRDQYVESGDRHVLYQALGAGIELDCDLAEVMLAGGDVLLLCSDGLTRVLDDDTIAAHIDPEDVKGSVNKLIEMVYARGAPDNVSIVALSFESEEGDDPIETVTEVMREVFLFREMTQPELLTIAPYLEEMVYEKGDTIVSEGDPADEFFIVVSGRVRVSRAGVHLTDVRPGGHFGELALARQVARSATVRALATTRLFMLSRERFHELLRHKPELGARLSLALLDAVGERLRDVSERLAAVERAVRGDLR